MTESTAVSPFWVSDTAVFFLLAELQAEPYFSRLIT